MNISIHGLSTDPIQESIMNTAYKEASNAFKSQLQQVCIAIKTLTSNQQHSFAMFSERYPFCSNNPISIIVFSMLNCKFSTAFHNI